MIARQVQPSSLCMRPCIPAACHASWAVSGGSSCSAVWSTPAAVVRLPLLLQITGCRTSRQPTSAMRSWWVTTLLYSYGMLCVLSVDICWSHNRGLLLW
jgi:hypothetical protein